MAPSTPGRLGYLGRKQLMVLVGLVELGSSSTAGQDRCTLKGQEFYLNLINLLMLRHLASDPQPRTGQAAHLAGNCASDKSTLTVDKPIRLMSH